VHWIGDLLNYCMNHYHEGFQEYLPEQMPLPMIMRGTYISLTTVQTMKGTGSDAEVKLHASL
jgi:hypothetical protein